MFRSLSFTALILIALPLHADDRPQVADQRLTLELIAEHPAIVTPTGVAVDAKGRVFAIENHTHHRPPEYKGPPTDRVRVYEDFNASGKARKITTFAEGFKDAMSLSFGPDGTLYLATRSQIFLLRDADKKVIVRLETKGNYPHNGLCGFAWDTNGDLLFGLGENLGEPYKLVGSNGSTLTGGGEGGSVYRCKPDGSKVSRISTGFWNPFGMTIDASGRLFVVDNDPDARGPCRLLHAVQGGDFGYRFRYGRKGTHPFQCWNGELPGTLPMVAGTSEAPSGVVACDFTAFSLAFSGELLITSWGDHTIERFRLEPRGGSVSATPKIVVRGDENFRPVAFSIAPDGSVVFTDWVDKSYPVHGKGRIWRLRPKPEFAGKAKLPAAPAPTHTEAEWFAIATKAPSPAARMDAILQLRSLEYLEQIVPILGDPDPFLASAALEVLGRPGTTTLLQNALDAKPQAALTTGILLALRKSGEPAARKNLGQFLSDPDPGVRRAAIQWVAEEGLKEYAKAVGEAGTRAPVTRELIEAWAKAEEMLGNARTAKTEDPHAAVAMLLWNPKTIPAVKAIALRMIPPDHAMMTPGLLGGLFKQSDDALKLEVVRTLMLRPDAAAQQLLREIALDERAPNRLRAHSVAGLAQSAATGETRSALQAVREAEKAGPDLRFEADRSLEIIRGPARRPTVSDWQGYLKMGGGQIDGGERVFFRSNGPGCYKCHRIDSRGSSVGTDLTFIGRSASREKIVESILEPSKEIAPAYTAWRITTRDGKERIGMIAGETFDSFVTIVDSQGKVEKIRRTDIEERVAEPKSIMPDNLGDQLTPREFLDLIAFLCSRK